MMAVLVERKVIVGRVTSVYGSFSCLIKIYQILFIAIPARHGIIPGILKVVMHKECVEQIGSHREQ